MTRAYWKLTDPVMVQAFRDTVRGQMVLEIGGASGELAEVMVNDLGAERVLVIEKELMFRTEWARKPINRVNFFWGYVDEFLQAPEFAKVIWGAVVVSWPLNNTVLDIGSIKVMRRAAQVVILGKNGGGTACGTDILWEYLVTRERLHHVPGLHNDLVVYGPNPRSPAQESVPIEDFGLAYNGADFRQILSPWLQSSRN